MLTKLFYSVLFRQSASAILYHCKFCSTAIYFVDANLTLKQVVKSYRKYIVAYCILNNDVFFRKKVMQSKYNDSFHKCKQYK